MKKLVLLLASIMVLSYACKKEEPKNDAIELQDQNKLQSVTYTVFSKKPKHVIAYISEESVWHKDTIYTQNFSKTVNVKKGDFVYSTQVTPVKTSPDDSIYLKAEWNGKKIESTGVFQATVELYRIQ